MCGMPPHPLPLPYPRPPPLRVDDSLDSPVRRDVDSEEVRRVYPDLPRPASAQERARHLRACDAEAYERERGVAFPPPS